MNPDANDHDSDAPVDSGADASDPTGTATPTGFLSFEEDTPGPDWFEPDDEEILAVLRENHNFAPSHVDEHGVRRGRDAAHRCRVLADHGLLTKLMDGMYEITDLGERLLEGEISPEELPEEAE
ncbi:hypothetical protein [Halobiforma nitratireducens]|uniref:Phage PhiH1 repressor protein n=1 Tax=Halobiforma nitratireducens JCM 10879 TaxID=1227454 RepID=M0LAB7_9EURY|nr:hypothetical protein [Halobiforma nitratireducens]EMA29404.1 hypothetical protein C446_17117 [Halobiforma nitratireducens JCM 10879]